MIITPAGNRFDWSIFDAAQHILRRVEWGDRMTLDKFRNRLYKLFKKAKIDFHYPES